MALALTPANGNVLAMRVIHALALLLAAVAAVAGAPTSAVAGERSYTVTGFDRIRVEGPFEIRLTVGSAPSARAEGDARVLDRAQIQVNGSTLVVSMGINGWGERGAAEGAVPVITITTPVLRTASVNGGGRITIAGMHGQSIDLAVTGSGAIEARGIDADQLAATVIGSGGMTLSGTARRARLLTNGPGTIDADALEAGDLTVRVDGAGETRARARYTADVTALGVGRVTVAGSPACSVHPASNHGPVVCGLKTGVGGATAR